jgi:hypothetical protein
MMFNGAADYFFWEGISKGVNNTINNLPGMLTDKFLMDNPTTKECLEMFEWGFYYGLLLTQDEFIALTEEPTTSIVSVTDTFKKQKLQPNHTGHC